MQTKYATIFHFPQETKNNETKKAAQKSIAL